jgi:hypothetical protein
MSLSFGTAGDAQLASGVYADCYLVDMHFSDAPVYLSTLSVNRTIAGNSYIGVGLLRVDTITTSEDGRPDKVKLSLPLTDETLLGLLLGSAQGYRGREIWVWKQILTGDFVPVGDRQLEWRGYMDPVSIPRQRGEGGITGSIDLPCYRAGMAQARRAEGLRITHAQQQARYPGDKGCEYIAKLVEEPSTWLSKKFQESYIT